MKLYIPTCTLNFNNILSSESISPLGFYARRGFGNKRFYPVCANDKDQVIILYSKYPRFEIEENDLENYPMVIEIETDDYKDGFFEKAIIPSTLTLFIVVSILIVIRSVRVYCQRQNKVWRISSISFMLLT